MFVTLVLTHACNLSCGYCYMGEHHVTRMPHDVARAALDMGFASPSPLTIGFFGGEPLIERDTMFALCDEARRRASAEGRPLRLTVTTNGTLIDDPCAASLARFGVDVALSIDGTRAAHDAARRTRSGASSFDAAFAAGERIRAAGLPLQVIAVVTPDNVRMLGDSVRFLASMGARRIMLNPCYEAQWSDDDLAAWKAGLREAAALYAERMRGGDPVALPILESKLRAAAVREEDAGASPWHGCSTAGDEIAVAPSGRLYSCARLVGEDRDRQARFVVGDVRAGVDRDRLAALLRGPADPACEPCAERWRCSAFCLCANVAETGATHLPGGVQCWHEQATARIADEVGHELLAEALPAFVARTYGGISRRARRLPVAR